MPPVYQQVKSALIKRLQQLPLESRLPSDRDLAREFNVAFLTINRVMNELMREGYVVRRARRGTFLASRERTIAAHDGGQGGEGSVLLASPSYFSHHYFRHVRLVEEQALKRRLRLIEYKLTPESTPENLAAVAAACADLRGILILPVPPLATTKGTKLLESLGKPVAFLSSSPAEPAGRHVHWWSNDWFATGRLAAEALLAAGHRRIAWVNHEANSNDDIARGMRQALKDAGLRGSDLATVGQGIAAWADSREAGYRLTQRLLEEGGATGAYYDSIAGVRGALRALWERNLRAPDHLSLVANGNQSGDEDYFTPPLTTLDADWETEVGEAFACILGDQPARTREHGIAVRLRTRASIGPPRG